MSKTARIALPSEKIEDVMNDQIDKKTGKGQKMWGGRFAAGPGALMQAINVSIGFDQRLAAQDIACLLYTSPSPRDGLLSRMPSSA